jgi:N-acetylmuramoyl-L-alanine amidase
MTRKKSRKMWRYRGWAFVLLAGLVTAFTGGPAAAAETQIIGVVVSQDTAIARVAVELNRQVDYQLFFLDEPRRAVIDLPLATWRLPKSVVPAGGAVAGYRFGQFDLKTSRLVLDLAKPVRLRDARFASDPQQRIQRLILELEPISEEAFATLTQAGRGSAAVPPTGSASGAQAAAIGGTVRAPGRRPEPKRVVVLDPGHGGNDPGAIGPNGVLEKDVTLGIARELKRQLEASGRYRVTLTRDDDSAMRLRDRVAKARAVGADLFVSIHADSMANTQMRGASIYTLSETASDAEAAALAARENRADLLTGIDLSQENKEVASILLDLAQRETLNLSAMLAGALVGELSSEISLLPTNPHRFAGFAVLKAPDVPSVLIELGYLSNQKDAMLLTRPHHRSKVAAAIARAMDRYFARRLTRS